MKAYAVSRRFSLLAASLLTLLAAGCSRVPDPAPPTDVVAKIGDYEIHAAEFQQWMKRRAVTDDPAGKQALLKEMLEFAAMRQKAHELGLDQDPELHHAWDTMLVSKLREQQLEPQLTNAVPATAQVEAYYQANHGSYFEPAARRGAILFVEVPAQAGQERKAEARHRIAEARAKALLPPPAGTEPRGFGAVAVEYSDDQITRYKGGDLGWVLEGRGDARLEKAILDVLFALPHPGDLSDTIETPRGFYLVKLLESRAGREKPLALVQSAIQHKLLIENGARIEAGWKQGIVRGYTVKINDAVLARTKAPVGTLLPSQSPPGQLP